MHSTGRDLGAGRARCAQGWRSGGAVRPRRMRHCRSGSAPYAERQAGHGPARPWSAAIEGPQEVTIGQGAISELAHLKQGAWDAAVGVGRGRAPLRPQPRRDLPPRRRCGRHRQRRGDRRQRAPWTPSQTLTDPHRPPHRRARLGTVIASAAWVNPIPYAMSGRAHLLQAQRDMRRREGRLAGRQHRAQLLHALQRLAQARAGRGLGRRVRPQRAAPLVPPLRARRSARRRSASHPQCAARVRPWRAAPLIPALRADG